MRDWSSARLQGWRGLRPWAHDVSVYGEIVLANWFSRGRIERLRQRVAHTGTQLTSIQTCQTQGAKDRTAAESAGPDCIGTVAAGAARRQHEPVGD